MTAASCPALEALLKIQEIKIALPAVRAAAEIARDVQNASDMGGTTKSDHSAVTVADFSVQAIINHALFSAFTEDEFVGEESSQELRQSQEDGLRIGVLAAVRKWRPEASLNDIFTWLDCGQGRSSGRQWVLDPIDGTKGYLRRAQYAIALAFLENGVGKYSILACPEINAEFHHDLPRSGSLAVAAKSMGSWLLPLDLHENYEPRKLAVSTVVQPESARLLCSVDSNHTNFAAVQDFSDAVWITSSPWKIDSQAKYLVLALGYGEYMLRMLRSDQLGYKECIWDHAPGQLILEEAGGRVTDLDGRHLDLSCGRKLMNNRGILASNGHLHELALQGIIRAGA